ncbi:amino acid transporter [Leptomonas pyrrhocoris]|uniref:Amino acid transporter n=1 Tax=Leptomonas pyrrhocoris TaxID=157538 RepID=A0A0M9G107_LEPPY|nr:amino acid transporter [Leptomonas pyrrhocoris]KPA80043.1 amino acid transporter [Leptomonas pyrrhocoris]|eukprot:XP_015658482.1 amino acid transporter [Leptomonas pyrrhocoris]
MSAHSSPTVQTMEMRDLDTTLPNVDGGTNVMEVEAPRLAQLRGSNDDSRAAAGLSQAQSPALSQCVSTTSFAELSAMPTLPRTAVQPPPPAHASSTSLTCLVTAMQSVESSPPRSTGASVVHSYSTPRHAADIDGGGHPLAQPTPPRRNNSSLSNMLSVQSNIVTPALSEAHTPRGGSAVPQLAVFNSVPATPVPEELVEECDGALHETSCDGQPPTQAARVDEDGVVIDVSEPGNRKSKAGRRDHFHGNVSEENLEFTSFGLDVSFMSAASSTGGPGGRNYASLYGAVFHVFKGNVGAGVFLLPTYYKDAGYVVGPICIALLGALMVDCTVSLLHVKHRINHVEVKTYPAVVEFVLGDWFQKFTQFALVFTQFGFCIMFLQYASSMLASLFEQKWVYPAFVAISTAVVTPMTFISNKLHLLMYASMLAGIFAVIILAGTTVVDVQHISSQGVAAGVAAAVPTARLIVFLSGHMFSLEGVGIVLPVENSLPPEKRVQYGHLLRYTLVSLVLFYIFFGVLGYIAYGEKLHTSVVLALPPSAVKRLLQVLLGLSLIFGFPIQYVPAIQIVDKAFKVNINEDKKKAFSLRLALNVIFGALAIVLGADTINIFASFLGAFAGVHLMITMPTLLALQVEHALNGDKDNYEYKDYLLLMFQGPYTLRRCNYYLYLLLALAIWIGGLYFTIVSVFVYGTV